MLSPSKAHVPITFRAHQSHTSCRLFRPLIDTVAGAVPTTSCSPFLLPASPPGQLRHPVPRVPLTLTPEEEPHKELKSFQITSHAAGGEPGAWNLPPSCFGPTFPL